MNYPKVGQGDAKNFGKVWNSGGIAIILDDVHFRFATDFANIALRSFIDQQIAQAKILAEKMKAQQAPQILTPTNAVANQQPQQQHVPAPKPSGIILTD